MTVTEVVRKRDPLKKALKLDALRQRQDALRVKIAKIEAKERAEALREDTRLKVIVGAAVLAHVGLCPEGREEMVEILDALVVARRDRVFLKGKGWL